MLIVYFCGNNIRFVCLSNEKSIVKRNKTFLTRNENQTKNFIENEEEPKQNQKLQRTNGILFTWANRKIKKRLKWQSSWTDLVWYIIGRLTVLPIKKKSRSFVLELDRKRHFRRTSCENLLY